MSEGSAPKDDTSLSPILTPLARLLLELDRYCQALERPVESLSGEEISVWGGINELYVEVRLPEALESSFDIAAFDSKIFLRIAR